jgi:hypothetical protein
VEQTTQEDIVQGFAQEAIRRGTQASNTPFMQPPLVGCFGFRGSSPVATAVLLGTFIPPPGTDAYVLKFLPHLKSSLIW